MVFRAGESCHIRTCYKRVGRTDAREAVDHKHFAFGAVSLAEGENLRRETYTTVVGCHNAVAVDGIV